MSEVIYAADRKVIDDRPQVTYLANGTKLVRYFDSPYKAKKFINKLKYSRRCKFVAASGFLM